MATISKLSVSLTARTRGFRKGMAKAGNTLKSFAGRIFSLKTAVVGLVGAAGIGFLAKGIINVNAKFQTLKASLKTMTGGTKQAAKAFDLIKKFAATTPFDLDQVVSGFIKLKALGLDPSESALKSYGNTAAAMGKTLNDMIEAVADASTGEFERLKEFGIKAKSQGDQVTFTFQGVATTVEKNAKAIEGYLKGIGDTTFGTAMQDQMGLLNPTFSNLGDAWEELATKIGEAGVNDLVVSIGEAATDFIKSITIEDVEKFTKAIVLFGFEIVRSILTGIKWLAGFGVNIKSVNILWLKLQKTVVDFGINSVIALAKSKSAIDSFLGTTISQQLERTKKQIAGLEENLITRANTGDKSLFGLGILPFYDPKVTDQMATDLGNLKAEAESLKNQFGQDGNMDFVDKAIENSLIFLQNASGKLEGDIASAERIFADTRESTLGASVIAGIEAAEQALDRQQKAFSGEDIKKLSPVVGRDPQLDSIDTGIKQLVDIQRTAPSAFPAFAG